MLSEELFSLLLFFSVWLGRPSFRVPVQFEFCVDAESYENVEFCVDVKSTMLKRYYFHWLDNISLIFINFKTVYAKVEDIRPNFLMSWTLNHFNSRTFLQQRRGSILVNLAEQ